VEAHKELSPPYPSIQPPKELPPGIKPAPIESRRRIEPPREGYSGFQVLPSGKFLTARGNGST